MTDDLSEPLKPCMFCGKMIAIEGPDPVTMRLEAALEPYRILHAHSECLQSCLIDQLGGEQNLR